MRLLPFVMIGLLFATNVLAQSNADSIVCGGSEGVPDEQIAACTREITLEQFSPAQLAIAYFNRGFAWSRKGDYDRAFTDYNDAIRLNPEYASAYNNRGNLWAGKRDYDRAITDYNEAIRLNLQDASAYNNRGNAWTLKGDYDRAFTDYNDAIRLNPQYAIAYYNRGATWNHKGDYDRAIADYDEAIRLDPQYAIAYDNRAVAWYSKGNYDRAIADYNEVIRLNPENADAYHIRGFIQFCLGRLEASAADFAQSLRLEPNRPYSVIWRYLALARSPIGDSAISALSANAAPLEKQKWPAPVIELLAGRLDPAALLKAAEHPDSGTRRDQLCEAGFYLGEWHLLNRRLKEGRALLQEAERNCPNTFAESKAATVELQRLVE